MIKLKELSKTYEYYEKKLGIKGSVNNLFHRKKLQKEAVKSLSFEISDGEFVAFLGPNGSGKTTTMKMLSGILYPTSGDALVMGYVPWERKKAFKLCISIVLGQKSQLWSDLPANEVLHFNKCIYELEDRVFNRTLNELTELLDVKHLLEIQVRRLSLGERMKLELIAALLHNPSTLLLDEPTIGLDLISQIKIQEFLKYYNEVSKTTIMLTSHNIKDIESTCNRAIVINHGSIVYDGELSKINNIAGENKIIRIKAGTKVTDETYSCYADAVKIDDYTFEFRVARNDVRTAISSVMNSVDVVDFNVEDIPLEEGIKNLYRAGDAGSVEEIR
jgi:ABC-2 type transport system ATP-binding protein